jgi:hypothetical protein
MTEEIVRATHGSPDHPLRFGDLEIACYVLEDGRRVLNQGSMISALGMSQGSASSIISRGDRLTKFAGGKALQPYVSEELLQLISVPIKFRTPSSSGIAYGYEATVLTDICEVVLRAREDHRLQKQQEHIAKQCEILVRGFARVGIIALVDEATGYQEFRARQALEDILRTFISEELLKWARTFPDEFYRELFRLRNVRYSEVSSKRPSYIGTLTNDIVYERLAPGVLEELQRVTPKDEKGRRKHKYFQRLTEDIGNPKLREHLSNVITLMKASPNWTIFYRLLQRALPKYPKVGDQLLLPLGADLQEPIEID